MKTYEVSTHIVVKIDAKDDESAKKKAKAELQKALPKTYIGLMTTRRLA